MFQSEEIDESRCIKMELSELPMVGVGRGYLGKDWYNWFIENGGKLTGLNYLQFPDQNTKLMFLLKYPERN